MDTFAESLLENVWEHLASNELLAAEVKLNCGYDAPGKEQAECLQRAWSREEGIELDVISPSDRPNIPRLVEIFG